MPNDEHSQGLWNAYVELGFDNAERKRRLAQVPEVLREKVKQHVITVFKLKKQAHEKSLAKQKKRGQESLFG